MDKDGKMVSLAKERGRIKAMERLIAFMDELGDNVAEYLSLIHIF